MEEDIEAKMERIFKYLRLPDFATILNALFGVAAIFLILQDRNEALQAAILILLGAMMDGLDGLLARKVEYGILGANLDSFADLITFGLAPAALCYVFLSSILIAIFAAFFLICGMLRLARFNILPKSEGFTGMPITAAGVFIALYVLAFNNSDTFKFIIPLLLLLSFLMVSRIPYPKIRDRRLLVLFGAIFASTVAGFYLNLKVLNTQLFVLSADILLALVSLYILIPIAWRALHYER